jgi:phosphoglycerate-specific signal transduction histidine kinase
MDQAVAVEKSLAAAGKKIQLLEDEIDEIRAKHRSTPEVALMQQLAEVKEQLADSERRIEMIKAEKSDALLEKEHFRANVNKLVGGFMHALFVFRLISCTKY